jgi:MFS family permease
MELAPHANRSLLILAAINAVNFSDRQVFGLVLQDISTEFHLSDTQAGFLMGFAFAAFYAMFGVPIARLADRGNRASIIAVSIALWGAAVAACGLTRNFVQLIVVRIFVAVGEAGCWPASQSLISSLFSRGERPRALSRYILGGFLGNLITALAGWANQRFGWRTLLFGLGTVAVPLALIVATLVKDPRTTRPRRGGKNADIPADVPENETSAPTFLELVKKLCANPTFLHVAIYICLGFLFGSGLGVWIPAFFRRSYHMQTAELGTWLSATNIIGGIIGLWGGGEWFARYAPCNERRQLMVMAGLSIGMCIFTALTYMSSDKYVSFTCFTITAVAYSACQGCIYSVLFSVIPHRMHAVALSLVLLVGNFAAAGLGPWVVGAVSDFLRPTFGEEGLRYALVAMAPGYILGAWHLWRASQSVVADTLVVGVEIIDIGLSESSTRSS